MKLQRDGSILTLSNGLITRQFMTEPAFGTVDYRSESKQRSILRAILSETNVTIDGREYRIGGLLGNATTHAYLNRSEMQLTADPDAFQYDGYTAAVPQSPFHWEPGLRHSPPTSKWPPRGLTLRVKFRAPKSAPPSHSNVVVYIYYEMYVGVPILSKWVGIECNGTSLIKIDSVIVEYLSTQKPYAPVDYSIHKYPWEHGPGMTSSWIYAESNEAHDSSCTWHTDPRESVDYGADEPALICYYTLGPGLLMGEPAGRDYVLSSMETFRALELVTDSVDRERVSEYVGTRVLNRGGTPGYPPLTHFYSLKFDNYMYTKHHPLSLCKGWTKQASNDPTTSTTNPRKPDILPRNRFLRYWLQNRHTTNG